MLVLDSDHLSEYQRGTSEAAKRLKQQLDVTMEPYGTTIISVEETMRGWMAAVRRIQDPRRQIRAYFSFRQLFRFFATWDVLEWDDAAVDTFEALRQAKIRVGTMDLKIASICLANGATVPQQSSKDLPGHHSV